ncbi:uncharacterized protein EV154DRAFT_514231 [Mucor mucedo]|uniref:uncharacterized protein n=1 Tax=Mucor mucedo TaxID=29922 RepID=UPI00221F6490|nr:uncharacterized protein EV154DRAFT_514231 [Mucor mucedo]KAI7889587.1 hypothetical protein EV154DRAFT_514231 [Mucor mucedo]
MTKHYEKVERRNSNSSQGSNSSVTLAADQRIRRKEQNRAAQRAFRERKERYVQELQDKIKQIEAAHAIQVSRLEEENLKLKNELSELKDSKREQSPTPSRIPSSAVACIRDKDGVSFCERLKEEVCSNAYDRLLTEQLFDAHGFLNETMSPVPIITSTKKQPSKIDFFDELEQSLNATPLEEPTNLDLISCSVVWNRMANHPLFEKFDQDALCHELKKRAKCSTTGPVFEEFEVQEVLHLMEDRVRNQEQQQQI